MTLVDFEGISESQYLEYALEWEASSEKIVPAASARKGRTFGELQARWRDDQTDAAYSRGFVPCTLYFLVDPRQRIVGAIHFRHTLNERLLLNGGHIGYGVRPSERGRGYATTMLRLLLEIAERQGHERVLLTCDEENIASQRTIEKCGGVLRDKLEYEGVWTRRYWIEKPDRA